MLFKTALFLAMPFAIMASPDEPEPELKLKARFTGRSGPIDGKVTIKQKGGTKTKGKWKVVIDSVDTDAIEAISGCEGFNGLFNWHVHDLGAHPGDESNCGADVTGGHYDPTYGCGGASQYKGTVCDYLKTNTRPDYVYACSQESQGKCEIGDQSGKMGKVDSGLSGVRQNFSDDWIGDVADLEGKSLVFHCCTTSGSCASRVACANLEVTNEDD